MVARYGPVFGVDGDLLIADSLWHPDVVDRILNGEPAQAWVQGFAAWALLRDYPQLQAEYVKRQHRKAYRAKLQARRAELQAQMVKPAAG